MSRPFDLLFFRQAKQSTSVTHFQVAMGQHGLDNLWQRDKAQQVGHGNPRLADHIGDLLLGQVEFLLQPRKGVGLFDRVEVFTLDIFDQRHGNGGFIRHIADHGRDSFHPRLLAGTPAALTGNDLKAIAADRTNHDRLHHALALDRVGEFFERLRVHVPTRLILATLDQIQREVLQLFLIDLYRLFFK